MRVMEPRFSMLVNTRRSRFVGLESAITAARLLEDRVSEAVHLGNMGVAHYLLGDFHRAIEYYDLNLSIAREIGDRRIEGGALANLGVAYDSLGEYMKAIGFYA